MLLPTREDGVENCEKVYLELNPHLQWHYCLSSFFCNIFDPLHGSLLNNWPAPFASLSAIGCKVSSGSRGRYPMSNREL